MWHFDIPNTNLTFEELIPTIANNIKNPIFKIQNLGQNNISKFKSLF